jgi:hypothetical protein
MPIKESLIQHGVDDEEYANAAPTIGETMLAAFSTPDPKQHNPLIYGADCQFFATHPDRRLYLRYAFPGEFDIFTTLFEFEQRPKLSVLVTQLCEGFHERTPRWRGRAFWKGGDSDRDVANAILEMSLRGGLSVSEWYGFISDQRVRKSDAAKLAKHSSKGSVN